MRLRASLEILALLEFLQQPLVIGERFGFLIGRIRRRLGQMEVDGVAVGVFGVVLQDLTEAIDRARDTTARGSSSSPTR